MDDAMRADDERDDDEGWIGRPPIDRRAEVVRRSRARRDGRDATRRDAT